MNTQEYIASGMLEQYVMGTLSAQEKQEVECMSHIYPEINAELSALQSAMEALAVSVSKTPPAYLRDKILGSLNALAMDEQGAVLNNTVSVDEKKTEVKTVSPETTNNIVTMRLKVMQIAASVLLVVSLGIGYWLFKNTKQLSIQGEEISSLKKELQTKEEMIALQTIQLNVVQNPDFSPVHLAGIPAKSPDSKATVYWNKKTNEVYIGGASLPVPATGKQYQLWAIADGKPVNMGMLNEQNMDTIFQKMKTIANAQAFAITLEKKGGVESPTMTEMYVMGGV